jgi:hypothetical protein
MATVTRAGMMPKLVVDDASALQASNLDGDQQECVADDP